MILSAAHLCKSVTKAARQHWQTNRSSSHLILSVHTDSKVKNSYTQHYNTLDTYSYLANVWLFPIICVRGRFLRTKLTFPSITVFKWYVKLRHIFLTTIFPAQSKEGNSLLISDFCGSHFLFTFEETEPFLWSPDNELFVRNSDLWSRTTVVICFILTVTTTTTTTTTTAAAVAAAAAAATAISSANNTEIIYEIYDWESVYQHNRFVHM